MAATLHKAGGTIRSVTYSNGTGSAISSGDVVVLASTDAKKCRVGVAMADIADGSSGQVAISGCFAFAKVSAAVIAQGESVNWDASADAVDDNAATSAAGDVVEFGMADEAAGNGATTINVWIDEPGTYDAA